MSATGTLCVAFLPNPTDPDAGTNRTNAVSRDNLMNGAELRYDGFYNATSLNYVGGAGGRWSATVSSDSQVYRLDVYPDGRIYPNDAGTRQLGRSVRYIAQILVLLIHYLWVWG